MIIDSHTHVFHPEIIKGRINYCTDHHFALLYNDQQSLLADHHQLLNSMDENRINHSMIMGFPWIQKEFCTIQNNYFSTLFQETSGKLIPFGSVPIDPGIDISSWVADIKALGLFGIGEVAFYKDGLNERNALFLEELLIHAHKHSLPVCIHLNEPVGHAYAGKYEPNFPVLCNCIQKVPGVTIILAHWGGGLLFYELMKEMAASFTAVFYDTAASPFLYADSIYSVATSILGAEKILFGSDYPLLSPKKYLQPIRNSIKNKTGIANILYGNARRILSLDFTANDQIFPR